MDFELPMLSLLVLIPLIGALITFLMGGERAKLSKYVALIFSAITLALSVYLLTLSTADLAKLTETYTWIEAIGIKINIIFMIDGLSILMVFLTALLVFLVVIASWGESDRPNMYHALLLAMEVGLMGVYLAQDYFLFYIMWEVTLIPMFFMISWYGGPRRHYSAIKFFIYTHVASVIMLIGIFAVVFQSAINAGAPVVDFSFAAVSANALAAPLSESFQILVFGLLFFGFAVKMPVPPFHTWLPDAHVEAPTGGSVLLAGVMLKMGSYGIMRICLDRNIFELAMQHWQIIIVCLGIIAMVYGAYACIAQNDLKKMVAYSSISHMGLVLVGIGCMSTVGYTYAIFQMFAHGLISAALFLVCGAAGHNFGTRDMRLLGGLAGKYPMFALFMMFSFMASLGLPGLMGFVAEFGLLYGLWEFCAINGLHVMIGFGLLYMMLTAGYYLWAMQKTLFGKLTDKIDIEHGHDLGKYEAFVLAVLCVFIALFGILPSIALDFIEPFVGAII